MSRSQQGVVMPVHLPGVETQGSPHKDLTENMSPTFIIGEMSWVYRQSMVYLVIVLMLSMFLDNEIFHFLTQF